MEQREEDQKEMIECEHREDHQPAKWRVISPQGPEYLNKRVCDECKIEAEELGLNVEPLEMKIVNYPISRKGCRWCGNPGLHAFKECFLDEKIRLDRLIGLSPRKGAKARR